MPRFQYGDKVPRFDRTNQLVELPLTNGGWFVVDFDFIKWLVRTVGCG